MLPNAYADTLSVRMSTQNGAIIPTKSITILPLFTMSFDRSHVQKHVSHYANTTVFNKLGTKSATIAANICRQQDELPGPIVADKKDLLGTASGRILHQL